MQGLLESLHMSDSGELKSFILNCKARGLAYADLFAVKCACFRSNAFRVKLQNGRFRMKISMADCNCRDIKENKGE
jgi:hypothetical protein